MKNILRFVLLRLAWMGLVGSAVMHLATFADINLGSDNSLNSVMWTLCAAVFASTVTLSVRGAKLSPDLMKARMKRVPLVGNLSSFLGVYILYVHFFGGGLVGDYVERDGQYRLEKANRLCTRFIRIKRPSWRLKPLASCMTLRPARLGGCLCIVLPFRF